MASTAPPAAAPPSAAGIAIGVETAFKRGGVEPGALASGAPAERPAPKTTELEAENAVERLAKADAKIKNAPKKDPKTGQFLPVDSGNGDGQGDPLFPAKTDAVSAEPPAEVPPAEQDAGTDADGAFEFAGQKFKTQADAEQAYKTLKGMHRSMDKRTNDAIAAANEWEAWANERVAEYEKKLAEKAGDQPAPTATRGEATKGVEGAALLNKPFVDAMGKEGWAEYRKQRSERGDDYAAAWLSDRMDEFHEAKFDAKLKKAVEDIRAEYETDLTPVREEQAQRRAMQNITTFWEAQAHVAREDGTYLYPEIQSPRELWEDPREISRVQRVVQEVGTIWREQVEMAGPQAVYDPRLLATAFRIWRAEQKANGNGSGGVKVEATDSLLDGVRRDATRGAAGVLDSGMPFRPADRGSRTAEDQFTRNLVAAGGKSPFGNFRS